jgi:hypothetical protein
MPSISEVFFSPPVYMAPTIVAFFYKKRASPLLYIFFINLLLGWTIMGWMVAWVLIVRSEASLRSRGSAQGQPAPAMGGVPVDMPCSSCGGSGRTQCLTCFGTRGSMQRTEMGEMWVNCNFCMGDGAVSCFTCGGRGQV